MFWDLSHGYWIIRIAVEYQSVKHFYIVSKLFCIKKKFLQGIFTKFLVYNFTF